MEDRIKHLLNKLSYRNMEGYYFETSKEAKDYLYSHLLKKGDSICFGGSVTFQKDMNLFEELKQNEEYHFIDRDDSSFTKEEMNSLIINCDDFFLSTNAITLDGELINIDGRGNRLCFMMYGPKNVYILVGKNKIVDDIETGIDRVRNYVAIKNAERLSKDTPCRKANHCLDCQSQDCICSQIVITRRSHIKNRIKVILINQELGY